MGVHVGAGLVAAICLTMCIGQAVASRSLLQQDSCLNVASSCASGPCRDFVSLQSTFPPVNSTDAQLQAFMNANERPTEACCASAGQVVTRRCQCDAQVQQFSALYNLTPATLVTFARAAKLSCGPSYIAANVNPYCSK